MTSALKTLLRSFLRVSLTALGLLKFRKFILPSEYALNVLRNTSIHTNHNELNVRFLNKWHQANEQFELGNFNKSFTMHRDLLTEVKELMKVDVLPNIYSYQFGSNLGHLACLFIHQSAQDLDLLPKRRMLLPHSGSSLQSTWLSLLRGNVALSSTSKSLLFTELPSNWPLVENLRLIYSEDGYIQLYSFLERYFKEYEKPDSLNSFEFPVDYLDNAQNSLERFGLKPGDPFVSLHIRNGSGVGIRRAQTPTNYVQGIKKLISLGYRVIRIGDPNMDPIPTMRHLIDLREIHHHWLHPFVLNRAKLHVGTMSGPSIWSMALRTPTLVTNATSLARNTLTGNPNTFYMPKHLFIQGHRLSLRESLHHYEGYSEIDGRDLQSRSISYVENSEEEILKATCEVIHYIESKSLSTESVKVNNIINAIRKEANALSFGKFVVSFCESNPQFLD